MFSKAFYTNPLNPLIYYTICIHVVLKGLIYQPLREPLISSYLITCQSHNPHLSPQICQACNGRDLISCRLGSVPISQGHRK